MPTKREFASGDEHWKYHGDGMGMRMGSRHADAEGRPTADFSRSVARISRWRCRIVSLRDSNSNRNRSVFSESMLRILTIGLPPSPTMNYEHAVAVDSVDIRASAHAAACRHRSMQTISGTRTLTTSCSLLVHPPHRAFHRASHLRFVRAPKRPPSNLGVPELLLSPQLMLPCMSF